MLNTPHIHIEELNKRYTKIKSRRTKKFRSENTKEFDDARSIH